MDMSSRTNTSPGAGLGGRPCQLVLRNCVAVTLRKTGAQNAQPPTNECGEFWMYDNGYLLFQNFLSANARCWWDSGLVAACRQLRYLGYVQGGVLLVGARDQCALEVIRHAHARAVLRPPSGHTIHALGDIDEVVALPVSQTQFTPLPEALCSVVLELSESSGGGGMGCDQTGAQTETSGNGLEAVLRLLRTKFPRLQQPAPHLVYDTLAQLIAERKVYHTSRGYFIVTPERRRSRSHGRHTSSHNGRTYTEFNDDMGGLMDEVGDEMNSSMGHRRQVLLTQDELLVIAHGDMATLRDGPVTHQCVQTSLRDVICGGSPSDKVIYPRCSKRRSASFPAAPKGDISSSDSPERRRSASGTRSSTSNAAMRLWGSARRLRRSASTRSLARRGDSAPQSPSSNTDSSSGTESSSSPKKGSLLSRLFRRSTKRSQGPLGTFSAQFPPTEWFNSTAIHLHSIGTQTCTEDLQRAHQEYYNSENRSEASFTTRSATLPRSRHRRHLSTDLNMPSSIQIDTLESPKRSPLVMRNYSTNSLPRSPNKRVSSKISIDSQNSKIAASKSSLETSPNTRSLSSKTSLDKMTPERTKQDKTMIDHKNHALKNIEKRNTLEYRSVRDTDKRYRGTIENRSVRETRSQTLERKSKSSTESGKTSSYNKSPDQNSLKSKMTIADVQCTSFESSITEHQSKDDSSTLCNSDSSISDSVNQNDAGCSGPSSLESQKTSSLSGRNSGPSSLESQRTVIPRESKNKIKETWICNSTPKSSLSPVHKSVTKSNSFTLQVTTNQNGVSVSNISGEQNSNNAITTATINGANTKIYVQNSPVRSVITFENGQAEPNSDYLIINNDAEKCEINNEESTIKAPINKNGQIKNTNQSYDANILNNSNATLNEFESKNNSRKLSLQVASKDTLNYKNVFKNVSTNSNPGSPIINFRDFTKNSFSSNPPSPTKSFDSFSGSIGNVYYDKNSTNDKKAVARLSLDQSKIYQNGFSLESSTNSINKIQEKNILGSEPNLSHIKKFSEDNEKTLTRDNVDIYNFPSLSDLSFNFTSLAAQKILKGVSINSIDTLVELNMAANNTEKQNNCNIQHTDFGMV